MTDHQVDHNNSPLTSSNRKRSRKGNGVSSSHTKNARLSSPAPQHNPQADIQKIIDLFGNKLDEGQQQQLGQLTSRLLNFCNSAQNALANLAIQIASGGFGQSSHSSPNIRSYSDAARANISPSTATPPMPTSRKSSYAVYVSSTKNEKPADFADRIMKKVSPNAKKISVNDIRVVKDTAIFTTTSKADAEIFRQSVMDEVTDVIAKTEQKLKPRLKIFDVKMDLEANVFRQQFINNNFSNFTHSDRENLLNSIKIIYKKRQSNTRLFYIVELDAVLRQHLVKQDNRRIKMDYHLPSFIDHFRDRRCYSCLDEKCRAKINECMNKPKCSKCGNEHLSKTCSEHINCYLCQSANHKHNHYLGAHNCTVANLNKQKQSCKVDYSC